MQSNETVTITLRGELDVCRAIALREELDEAAGLEVVLDLRAARISRSALAALIPMLASLHRRIVRTWAGDGTGQTVLRLAPAV